MRSADIRLGSWIKTCGPACVVGAVYFLAACLAFKISQGVGGIATIWPASGVFVSGLLIARPGHTAAMACAVAAASLAANLLFGATFATASTFTFANVLEGLLISQLVIRTAGAPHRFDDTRWLATFFGATLIGSLVSSMVATVLAGGLTLAFFVSWFMTVSLGTLIITPLVVTIASDWRQNRPTPNAALQLFALTVSVAAVSLLVLSLEDGRFLFLPMIAVIAATYMFGARGAALSISVIAIVATLKTDFSGPVLGSVGLSSDTLFLQFFLLSLLCAAWPLSALMAEKARLIEQYAEANKFLEMAETAARIGHWHIGPNNTSLFWSKEVYRIHGIDPDGLMLDETMHLQNSSSLGLYHSDDRDRVRGILVSAMDRHQRFSYEARIVRPDGSIRHISSAGHPRYSGAGEFNGLFGTLQDVTEQAETLIALQLARNAALSEADTARWLSETDELTGMANRRKALGELRAAVRATAHDNSPLSLAILDIDHFKSVNDQYGHHIGDEVLKRVAQIISAQLRPTDLVGRLGGEEFVVILPGQDGPAGFSIIERIRLRIASEKWTVTGLPQITVSAGITTVSSGDEIEDALKRADQALYRAKNDGRNLLRAAA